MEASIRSRLDCSGGDEDRERGREEAREGEVAGEAALLPAAITLCQGRILESFDIHTRPSRNIIGINFIVRVQNSTLFDPWRCYTS